MAAVDDKVKQIIVEQLGVDEGEVTPSASFVDDLGADSLDTVELSWRSRNRLTLRFPTKTREDPHGGRRGGLHREALEEEGVGFVETGRRYRDWPDLRVGNTSDVVWKNCWRARVAWRRSRTLMPPVCVPDCSRGQGFDPLNFIEKKEVKKMGRFIIWRWRRRRKR